MLFNAFVHLILSWPVWAEIEYLRFPIPHLISFSILDFWNHFSFYGSSNIHVKLLTKWSRKNLKFQVWFCPYGLSNLLQLVQQNRQQALKVYCPNIYNVSTGQPNVKNVTLVSLLVGTWFQLKIGWDQLRLTWKMLTKMI